MNRYSSVYSAVTYGNYVLIKAQTLWEQRPSLIKHRESSMGDQEFPKFHVVNILPKKSKGVYFIIFDHFLIHIPI